MKWGYLLGIALRIAPCSRPSEYGFRWCLFTLAKIAHLPTVVSDTDTLSLLNSKKDQH